MNILQLLSSGAGCYGAESVAISLSVELERLGVHSVVAAFRNSFKAIHLEALERAQHYGLTTAEVNCRGRLDRIAIRSIRQLLFDHKIDVIHSHGPKPNFYARLAARGLNTSLVSTCHSWRIESLAHFGLSCSDCLVLREFDAVAGVSEAISESLRRIGLSANKVQTIRNGINLGAFLEDGERHVRPELENELIIGTAARLERVKGLNHLIEAAAILQHDFPLAKFRFAGDGPELNNLRRLAAQLGVSDRVEFLGTCREMAQVYLSFDVFALPSLSEGAPMALMEAMATGRAVVATAVGAIPTMIHNRFNGILVQPGNTKSLGLALCELLASSQLRESLGSAARDTARAQFSAWAMAKRYRDLYSSVAQGRNGQGDHAPLPAYVSNSDTI